MNIFNHLEHNALMTQEVEILVSRLSNQVGYSQLQQYYHLNNNLLGKNLVGKPKNMNLKKKMIMIVKKGVMRTKQLTNPQLEVGSKLASIYDQEPHNRSLRRESSYLHLTRMMSQWRTLYPWMDLILPKSHKTFKIRKRLKSSQYSNDSTTFKRKKSC